MDSESNFQQEVKEESAAFRRSLRTMLHAIKELTRSEEVTIWLRYFDKNRVNGFDLEMDDDEMKLYFNKRIKEIKDANPDIEAIQHLEANATDKYSILKFVASTGTVFQESDYLRRPEKYLVLDKVNLDYIKKEGIATRCVRKGVPIILLNEDQVREYKSRRSLNVKHVQNKDAKQIVVVPIKDDKFTGGEVIGCIKVENINSVEKTLSQETIKILEREIPLLCTVLKRSQDDDEKLSYDTLFQGIKFLETLKSVREKVKATKFSAGGEQNLKVYEKLLHLFYVLKRKAYVGHDPIMERVVGFCQEISRVLKINFNVVKDLLESFKRHEDLFLYSHNEYRDHFMHQFHVFCCGYVILNHIGFKKVIDLLKEKHGLTKELTIFNVLRIWFFTSFFHDFSYILPKIDRNISNFLSDILHFRFSVNFDWTQLVKPRCKFEQSLQEIVGYFDINRDTKTNPADLLAALDVAMINLRDHGVLSAILFFRRMKEEGYIRH